MEDSRPALTISFGRNIVSAADELVRIPLADVARMIADPSSDLARQVSTLRNTLAIDPKRYREMKRALPYLVCAAFAPSFRKGENFAFADCFVVDVDHVAANGLTLSDARARLQSDPRVALCFASPSADGLKVVFRLTERCFDKGTYSVFYKLFIRSLAQQYGLEDVLDTRTSDVTRACFLSTDQQVYVNEDAQPVNMADYAADDDTFDFIDLQESLRSEERKSAPAAPTEPVSTDPDTAALSAIKQKLAQKMRERPAPPAPYVPEELDVLMPKLIDYIVDSYGLDVYEVVNIQYGKKMRARLGAAQAEINLFFGKRGFRPVISPRSGTNASLNQSLFDMAECFLADYVCESRCSA